MFLLIEIFIFLSTILPIFHLVNALLNRKKQNLCPACNKERMFSILIPCYNEEDIVEISVDGLLALDYRNFEAIYINDGSADNTLTVLDQALELKEILSPPLNLEGVKKVYQSRKFSNFFVIDKEQGGKGAALNSGILYARADLIVTLDADTVLRGDALGYMNRAFEDQEVVAAGGSIHIMQGYNPAYLFSQLKFISSLLVTLQILEYLKGFYIYKMSLSRQQAMAIISGAFSVFKKDMLLFVGGYRNTLGEDIDITMRIQKMIHKTGQKILYLPEALCYTQCPENWHDLKKQRIRWQKGFVDCALYQKWFLLKTFLFKSLSFHFLVEAVLVGFCSCLFTILSYIFVIILAFGDNHAIFVFAIYFVFCAGFNVIYDVSAITVSVKYNQYPRAIMKKMGLAIVIDIFFYRYFTLIMYLGGTVSYFWHHGENNCWNKISRNKSKFLVIEEKKGVIYG